MYMFIYIYIERERVVCIHIYIYIYRERERCVLYVLCGLPTLPSRLAGHQSLLFPNDIIISILLFGNMKPFNDYI